MLTWTKFDWADRKTWPNYKEWVVWTVKFPTEVSRLHIGKVSSLSDGRPCIDLHLAELTKADERIQLWWSKVVPATL